MSGFKGMRSRPPSWTPEQDEALRSLVENSFSASQVARLLNVMFGSSFTRNAVIGRAHREKIKFARVVVASSSEKHARKRAPRKPRLRAVIGPILRPLPLSADVVQCDEIETRGVVIVEVTGCRWPVSGWKFGDGPIRSPAEEPIRFCNHPQVEGEPYCAGHCQLAYRRDAA